jgi:hypothetical protein
MTSMVDGASTSDVEALSKRRYEYEQFLRDLQPDVYRLLWSSSLDFVKNTAQLLQALTTFLISAYLGFLGALGTSLGVKFVEPVWVLLPIVLLLLSLGSSLLSAVIYRGEDLFITDLEQALQVYEDTLRARRRQLWAPALCFFAALLALTWLVYQLPGRGPA